MFKGHNKELGSLALIALLLSSLLALPLLFILSSVDLSVFSALSSILMEDQTINTLILLVGTALLSLIFGVSSAWFCSRFEFPLSRFFSWALMLPLAIPSYILAYTYKGMLGLYGSSHALIDVYWEVDNIWSLCLIMALSLFPYVFITSRVSFMHSSRAYIESASSLGKSMWRIFYSIVLPVSWPAIFGGLILVMMEVLNNYGAVSYFGIKTFTTEIVRLWNPMNTESVQRTAFVLIFIVGIIYLFERQLRKKRGFADQSAGVQESSLQVLSPFLRIAVFIWCALVFVMGFALPFIQLAGWAVDKWMLILDADMLEVISTTFGIGLSAALISTALAFFIRYITYHHSEYRVLKFVSQLPQLGYAIPGALLGVGLLSFLMILGRTFGINLTQSMFILIFAYLARFYSVSYGSLDGGMEKLKAHLALSSYSSGHSVLSTMGRIHFPLLKNVMLASLILVFVDVIKELPLTMMFQRFNFQTLAVKSYMLMETDGAIYDASLPSLLIVLISIIPMYFVNRLLK